MTNKNISFLFFKNNITLLLIMSILFINLSPPFDLPLITNPQLVDGRGYNWRSIDRPMCSSQTKVFPNSMQIIVRPKYPYEVKQCLTSPMLISASVYCRPFMMMLRSAAGGTKAPLMLDWLMWLSIPNVYAECTNPEIFIKKRF